MQPVAFVLEAEGYLQSREWHATSRIDGMQPVVLIRLVALCAADA